MIECREKQSEQDQNVWRYEMTTTDVDGDDDMRYTTYGIRATSPRGGEDKAFADVSTKRDFVQTIVDLCNSLEASGLHLEDILDDFIG